MTTFAECKSFWSEICVEKALPLALRYFATAHFLACPSSCEAEHAISTLNRTVTALRSSTTWAVRLHLIGAEDCVMRVIHMTPWQVLGGL